MTRTSAEIASSETVAAGATAAEVVELGHGLEIKDVDDAYRRLRSALDRGGPMTVDLSAVAAADTAGVQLLLSLQREASSRGIALEWRGVSGAVVQALRILGLNESFVATARA